jgi:hypothetical protein
LALQPYRKWRALLYPPSRALRSIKQHLLALGPLNRRSRFLGNLADDAISAYTRQIDPFRVVLTGGWTPVSAL